MCENCRRKGLCGDTEITWGKLFIGQTEKKRETTLNFSVEIKYVKFDFSSSGRVLHSLCKKSCGNFLAQPFAIQSRQIMGSFSMKEVHSHSFYSARISEKPKVVYEKKAKADL
jgi:hypothetical protein